MKIIHVNRTFIAANAKDGGNRPVYIVREKSRVTYAREIEILGPSKLVYNGDQLSCGARAWIETDAEIEMTDPMPFKEAKAKTPDLFSNRPKAPKPIRT